MDRGFRRPWACSMALAIISTLLSLVACSQDGGRVGPDGPPPADLEAVVWEHQNWEVGGGYCRRTLWADGGSELRIAYPMMSEAPVTDRLALGWAVEYGSGDGLVLVQEAPMAAAEARSLFEEAWSAGIGDLEPQEPDYQDGNGYRAELRFADGRRQEVSVAMFPEERYGSPNHRRFSQLDDLFGPCPWKAFVEKVP